MDTIASPLQRQPSIVPADSIVDEVDQAHAGLSEPAKAAIRAMAPNLAPGLNAAMPKPAAPTPGPADTIQSPLRKGPSLPVDQPSHLNPNGPGQSLSTMQHTAELNRLESSKPGVDTIQSPLKRTLGKIGDVALSIMAPGAAAAIPGTTLHHQALIGNERAALGAEAKNAETGARTTHEQAEAEELPARADEERARAEALRNPQAKQEEAGKTITTDQGIMQWNPQTQRYDIEAGKAPGAKAAGTVHQLEDGSLIIAHPDGTATPVTVNGQPAKGKGTEPSQNEDERNIQSYLKEKNLPDNATNRAAAKRFFAEQGGKPATEAGTWQIQEDENGKPIEYNTKTGQTRPVSGVQKSGTHAKAAAAEEKVTEPIRTAQGYADEYLKRGVFTGPGDEALMERFFDVAKPSTGFRMSQPQINMLNNARGWLQGAEARVRHAATGTWFSTQQRQEIANTISDIANAKLKAHGGGAQPSGTLPGGITLDEIDAEIARRKAAKK